MKKYKIFVFISLVIMSLQLFSADVVEIKTKSLEYNLDSVAEFWAERDIAQNHGDILPEFFIQHPRASKNKAQLTYDDQKIWVRISLRTEENLTSNEWLFKMTPSDSRFSVTVFNEKGQAIYRDLKSTDDDSSEAAFHLDANTRYTLVIRCTKSNFLNFKLMQWAYSEGQLQKKEFDIGLFYGALIVLLVYNLLIFFVIRESSYFYYFFYLSGMISVLAIMIGKLPLNEYQTSIAILTAVAFLLFTRNLLSLKNYFSRFQYLFIIFSVIGIVLSILAAFPDRVPFIAFVESAGDIFIISCISMMLLLGFVLSFRGDKNAKIYVLAWTPLFLAFFIYLLRYHFLKIPIGRFDVVNIHAAVLIQTLIFTAAFTFKVKDLEVDNAVQAEKAKEADRMRNLVRVVCHDIANPLTVIIAHANWKKEEGDPIWGTVSRASEKINDLVHRVKTLQALESGKQKLSVVGLSIERILMAIKDTFDLKFKEKNIEFVLEVSNEILSKKVAVDPVLFESTVMNNLMSNAIKFSYPGSSIYLRVKEQNEIIVFEVEDHGMGIPKKLLEKIFSTQEKTSRQGTKGEKGTGFGMPLIKSLLEGMNGEIRVTSETVEENPELKHGRTNIQVLVKKA